MFQKGFVPPDLKIILKFEELIEYYFKENKPLAFYCDKLNVKVRLLNRYVKFYWNGRIAKDLIRDRKNNEALEMISETCMSVKEISCEVGIQNPSYFSKRFKEINGRTPSEQKRKTGKDRPPDENYAPV